MRRPVTVRGDAWNLVACRPLNPRWLLTTSATRLKKSARGCIQLSVADTGSGMDSKVREQIFEPFFTTKPVGKGTGLGLATVYAIVREAGGQILVYSQPGQGSVFKVFLPAIQRPAPTVVAAPAVESDQPLDGGTVLLVEDDPDVCEFASTAIGNIGIVVMTAGSGREAIEICQRSAGAGPAGDRHRDAVDYRCRVGSTPAHDAAEPQGAVLVGLSKRCAHRHG